MARTPNWPKNMVIQELYLNDNSLHNHLHVAACDRAKLVQLARIAQRHYDAGDPDCVREFPGFDTVEDVHTNGSFHYRQHGRCREPRNFSNRGNGLAFDMRSRRRHAFARELKRRYKVLQSDF